MTSTTLLIVLIIDLIAHLILKFNLFIIIVVNIAVAVYIQRRYVSILIETFPRDIKGLYYYALVARDMRRHLRKESTIGSIFRKTVDKNPHKIAFINVDTGKQWSFIEIEKFANQIANYFLDQGLRKGDVVALLLTNQPEYVAVWLGLSKIGVITALLNTNLRSESLGYCIKIANAKHVIIGSEFQTAYEEDLRNSHVDKSVPVSVIGDEPVLPTLNAENLKLKLKNVSTAEPPRNKELNFRTVLIYIYTSGTTGLPKAAVFTHSRFYMAAAVSPILAGINANDRVYLTMPLYHTAAGIMGIGGTLLSGCTSIVRKKFSASSFWDNCVQYECTASQYIGEICRYLLSQPSKAVDRQHKIRVMFGNGLRPQIWNQFVERFGIDKIVELYGSTEGNANLCNFTGYPGACGFLPVYGVALKIFPISLIKVDPESGAVIRDKNGLCIRCQPGECGELVAKIIKNHPLKDFTGYLSEKDTKKKQIMNVFSKGDVGFSSGDLLYMDEKGYIFFKDRTGDTFRWKGENVSTTEVEGDIHKIVGLKDAVVYGVEIPNCDGRAGMAAIADEDETIDVRLLNKKLKEMLPTYARPIFLRLCKTVETTGTFKLKKSTLQKEHFDPSKCGEDKLYYYDFKADEFKFLTTKEFDDICQGRIKF